VAVRTVLTTIRLGKIPWVYEENRPAKVYKEVVKMRVTKGA